MNFNGKMNLFTEGRDAKTFRLAMHGSIGSRKEQGKEEYNHASISVDFVGEKFPKEVIDRMKEYTCYVLDVTNGFIAVDAWETNGQKRTKLVFKILDATVLSSTPYTPKTFDKAKQPKDGDLPF